MSKAGAPKPTESSWGAPRGASRPAPDGSVGDTGRPSSRTPLADKMMMRLLGDGRSWSVEAGAATHLDETDMLFALAKAGGGVHLAECHACHDEARAIEDLVAEFEAGELQPAMPQLERKLLGLPGRLGLKGFELAHTNVCDTDVRDTDVRDTEDTAPADLRRFAAEARSREEDSTKSRSTSRAATSRSASRPRPATSYEPSDESTAETGPGQLSIGTNSDAAETGLSGPRPAAQLAERHESDESERRARRGSGRRRAPTGKSSVRKRRRRGRENSPVIWLSGLAAAAVLTLAVLVVSSGRPDQGGSRQPGVAGRDASDPRRGPLVSDRLRGGPVDGLGRRPGDPDTPDGVDRPEGAPIIKGDGPAVELLPAPADAPKDQPKPSTGSGETPKAAPKGSEPTETPGETGPGRRVEGSVTRKSDKADGGKNTAETPGKASGDLSERDAAKARVDAFARRQISSDGGHLVLATRRIVGRLALQRAGENDWRALRRGDASVEVSPGDRLRSRGGPVFMTLESGVELDLAMADKTEVRIEGATDGPVLGVAGGKIACDFDRHFQPQVLVVNTPHGSITADGSSFAMNVDDAHTTAHVYEGMLFSRVGNESLVEGRAWRMSGEGKVGSVGRAIAAAWSRSVQPRRELLYSSNFERTSGGFVGKLVKRESGGHALLAEPSKESEYFGLLARLRKGGFRSFRALEGIELRFSFKLEQSSRLLVQLYNVDQQKAFRKNFGVQEGGRWQRVTVNVLNDLSTYFAPGKTPVRKLDLFNEVTIWSGKPGETFRMLIDDVEIYRKIYR